MDVGREAVDREVDDQHEQHHHCDAEKEKEQRDSGTEENQVLRVDVAADLHLLLTHSSIAALTLIVIIRLSSEDAMS